jgi:hypothetical protein
MAAWLPSMPAGASSKASNAKMCKIRPNPMRLK